jgi:hypothetical protein
MVTNHVCGTFYLEIKYQIIHIAFGESSTNLGRVDHTDSSEAGQNNKEFILPSSLSEINDQNVANKSGKQ